MDDHSEGMGAAAERAVETGHEVAAEATEQARAIGEEVRLQTGDLVQSVRTQLDEQAVRSKELLVTTLRQLSDEFDEIAPHASGTVGELSGQASSAARGLSDWLANHEPSDVLRSVEDMARRRPMGFLLVSAVAGVVVGRVTRSMLSTDGDDGQSSAEGDGGNGEPRSGADSEGQPRAEREVDTGERERDYGQTPEVAPAFGDFPPSAPDDSTQPESPDPNDLLTGRPPALHPAAGQEGR